MLGDFLDHTRYQQIMGQTYGVAFEFEHSGFVYHARISIEMSIGFHFNSVSRRDLFQPVKARGKVDVSCMEDHVYPVKYDP